MTTELLRSGATLVTFDASRDDQRSIARAQNFTVEWIDETGAGQTAASTQEMILLLTAGTARLDDGREEILLDGPAAAIVPAGRVAVASIGGGPLLVLATDRPDLGPRESAARAQRDDRIAPVGVSFARRQPLTRTLVMPFDAIPNPSGNPRIRFLQSATMSINIVRYEGARDATSLSPHAHSDIEQGSLAVYGDYVHHLRTPWGKDMANWRDDEHLEAGPGTLLLIPPELIHTTQGVGGGVHLLVDIFAPPRRDFIAKGWIANADEYRDPLIERSGE